MVSEEKHDAEIVPQRQNPANFPEESRDYTDVEERKMKRNFFLGFALSDW
jgi:hypothetical protein